MKKAVVIFSGGLDSTTCLYLALKEGYEVSTISFRYGQRHIKELDSARKIVQVANIKDAREIILPVPTSALTGASEIPTNRTIEEMQKVPPTEVAFRNQIFLSHALQYANEIGAEAVYIGVTAIDYSGYPDCRPEFIRAMQQVIDAQEKNIAIVAPLLQLYKAEIIELGTELGVPYNLTWSCYKGEELACGQCDSCLLRLKGFKEANLTDPIEYVRN